MKGQWQPILTVEEWEAVVDEYERRRSGKEFTTQNTRKHLLSGFLRCGRPREDGTLCGKPMNGTVTTRRTGKVPIYRCPGPIHGGCGSSQRNMAKLDELITDLFFAHLEQNAPDPKNRLEEASPTSPAVQELEQVRSDLQRFRHGMRDRTISATSFFEVVPALEAREKELVAIVGRTRRAAADRARVLRTPSEVRNEWERATAAGRRALLGQYLQAIVVHPSQTRGPVFDHSTIEPLWKPPAA